MEIVNKQPPHLRSAKKFDGPERWRLQKRIRELLRQGETVESLPSALERDGFRRPNGMVIELMHVRNYLNRMQPGGKKQYRKGGQVKEDSTALPTSLQLVLEDEELDDTEKLIILKSWVKAKRKN